MNDIIPMNSFTPSPALPGDGISYRSTNTLSRQAKATAIARLLLNEGTDLPLVVDEEDEES